MKTVNTAAVMVPKYGKLISPTFKALKNLGGSGNNSEILNQVILDLKLDDVIVDYPHLGSNTQTELAYQLAWARTYLARCKIIKNGSKAVWSICDEWLDKDDVDPVKVIKDAYWSKKKSQQPQTPDIPDSPEDGDDSNNDCEFPDEAKPWKKRLSEILMSMNPFGFERLAQRVLRECGFTQVNVTQKTGDGGIDGTGKLMINGIFSFSVAFQCKRYGESVGAPAIRDFRGSLSTDIEKGIMITTGSYTKAAIEEASKPGKKQIDLIDGDAFISKIAEYNIGVKPVITYEIDEDFFNKI